MSAKTETKTVCVDIRINTIDELKNLVAHAARLKSSSEIHGGRYIIDARSIMGVLSLNLSEPVSLIIYSVDDDETDEFLTDIGDLIVAREENKEIETT